MPGSMRWNGLCTSRLKSGWFPQWFSGASPNVNVTATDFEKSVMPNSEKLREYCGVVAIFNHPEAEKLAYLGMHALQHRGQESAGIVTSDGITSRTHKAMGSVADIFTEDVLSKISGRIAIG